MVKKKGDKPHSQETKQLIISLINDYKLFNASDAEMMRLISQKIGKTISYTLFSELKKESTKRDNISIEWLENYTRGRIVDHYWTRIKELEYVQRILLDEITKEYSKSTGRKPYLINQLAKTIGELSTKLSDMGMSPPVIAKLYSLIPQEILNGTVSRDPIELEKYIQLFNGNMKEDREKAIPKLDVKENVDNKENEWSNGAAETTDGINNEINPLSRQTSLPPPVHKEDDFRSNGGTQGTPKDPEDQQRVF